MFRPPRDRDASASIRGYVFQIDGTIDRWLTLDPDQILELERGEDIDLVSRWLSADGTDLTAELATQLTAKLTTQLATDLTADLATRVTAGIAAGVALSLIAEQTGAMRERVNVFPCGSGHGEIDVEPPQEYHINQWLSTVQGRLIQLSESESDREAGGPISPSASGTSRKSGHRLPRNVGLLANEAGKAPRGERKMGSAIGSTTCQTFCVSPPTKFGSTAQSIWAGAAGTDNSQIKAQAQAQARGSAATDGK